MKQLALDAPTLLVLGNERRFSDMARNAIDELRAVGKITLHFWSYESPREFALTSAQPGLTIERRGLRIAHEGRGIAIRWGDVFMVQTDKHRFLEPRRLYDLPREVARELLAEDAANNRDSWELLDSLRRAMAGRPDGFHRAFYAPSFIEQLDARAADTARKLRLCDDADRDDTTPVCAFTGYRVQRATTKPTAEETETFLDAEREQLGVDRVRGTVVDPRCL